MGEREREKERGRVRLSEVTMRGVRGDAPVWMTQCLEKVRGLVGRRRTAEARTSGGSSCLSSHWWSLLCLCCRCCFAFFLILGVR
jgi:hypothetical protein